MIADSLADLAKHGKLHKSIILWGINNMTQEIISWLRFNGYGEQILYIVDNFKSTFCHDCGGIAVVEPWRIRELNGDSVVVILLLENIRIIFVNSWRHME